MSKCVGACLCWLVALIMICIIIIGCTGYVDNSIAEPMPAKYNVLLINDCTTWIGIDLFEEFLLNNDREISHIIPMESRGWTQGYYVIFKRKVTE